MRPACLLLALSIALTSSGAARAAPPPPKPDAATEKARALHTEGDAHFAKADFARARDAYLAAWALKKHFQIAGNLGDAEARLGIHRDAAEHLAYYLREAPKDDPSRESAKKLFNEAVTKVAVLHISVDLAGAEVHLDGAPIGTAPLPDDVYAEPGAHTLEARLGTRSAKEEVGVAAGATRVVFLDLKGLDRKELLAPPPAEAPEAPPAPAAPEAEEATEKSLLFIVIGSSFAALGLGIGIGMTVAANAKSGEVDSLRVGDGGPSACYRSASEACRALNDAVVELDSRTMSAGVGYGAAAAAAGLTLAYALVPLPGEKRAAVRAVRATPWVGATGAGLSVGGKF